MKVLSRLVPAAAAALAVAAFAAPAASASTVGHHDSPGAHDAVFVQTDNTAGNAVAAYRRAGNGALTLAATYPTGGLGNTSTDAGTVDAAGTPNGRFLYVQAGGPGVVDEFAVGHGGSLTKIGSVTVAGAAGSEGIAAS